jgi:hypothetical protein
MSRCPTSIRRIPSASWERRSSSQAAEIAGRVESCATTASSRSWRSWRMKADSLEALNCHVVSWVRTVNPPAHMALAARVAASGPARPPRR